MSKSIVTVTFVVVAIGSYTLVRVINQYDGQQKATKSLIGNYTKCFLCQEQLKYDSIAKSLMHEDFATFTLKDDYEKQTKQKVDRNC